MKFILKVTLFFCLVNACYAYDFTAWDTGWPDMDAITGYVDEVQVFTRDTYPFAQYHKAHSYQVLFRYSGEQSGYNSLNREYICTPIETTEDYMAIALLISAKTKGLKVLLIVKKDGTGYPNRRSIFVAGLQ